MRFKKSKEAIRAECDAFPLFDSYDLESYDEAKVVALLNKKVENPVLSSREKRLLELAQTGRQDLVEAARDYFVNPVVDVCPMCQRAISMEEKQHLVADIQKVLSDEVDEYKEQLASSLMVEVEMQTTSIHCITKDRALRLESAVADVNRLVRAYNSRIDERRKNVFARNLVEPMGLGKSIDSLRNEIDRANEEIDALNKAIKSNADDLDSLSKLNDEIAYLDAKSALAIYEKKQEELKAKNDEYETQTREMDELERKRENLVSRMENIDVAVSTINAFLATVFFDANRFVLVPEGKRLKILSNGKPVKPKAISTGERNILALCYFFSEGGKDRRKAEIDLEKQFIVLDDPISSFDMENRVGVCSLIRARARHIFDSNDESRMVVFTHDKGVAHELMDVFRDADLYSSSDNKKVNACYLHLDEGTTVPKSIEKERTEYSMLLQDAYDFARKQTHEGGCADECGESAIYIGNMLRRVLEGYSTFNYGIGMMHLTRDPELKKRIGSEIQPALENMMYRLALNDGSHMKDRVSSLNSGKWFENYSYEEKLRCARCAFVILNQLDKEHVIKLLRLKSEKIDEYYANIDAWESELAGK